MTQFLSRFYFGNSLQDWLISLSIFVGGILLIAIFKRVVLKRLKLWAFRSETTFDDFLIANFEKSVVPLSYLAIFRLAINMLEIGPKIASVLHVATLLYITFFILRIITSVVKKFIFSFIKTSENRDSEKKQAKGLLLVINIIIWILGIVFIIDNLGYNVTTLITGLGIGGIAIALAAQTILGDLFSYFVIFFDRPFEIGDFIIVENNMGSIEYIGIKTTRIRTLSGEQLICSNTYLTNSRIHNFKRMEERRIVFKLGVTYQTSSEQVKAIPAMVKEIIKSSKNVRLDRGHFAGFGDFSLDFEFVYYILSSDYSVFMDKQEEIYFGILCRFEAERIEFAYPTQTLFTVSSPNVQEINNKKMETINQT
ncbi:MAG: mechanosensitive ion channel [Daejeonella sp.]|uniref:mechanosensitive ion channel family protein n=1 Tax=Daejeonella sp. TaxID=2805397 RepID=UPI002732F6C7|nr:mechanosensitive ion channel family protein [Daejeonella sp.]MDP3468439.1 mechanosensitive ion channel [Daejeonella sp.]